uniref:Uncharacterized protein n=1 Tax=Rhizophagus irregularis (strain DAOM 181602 / DAOM 197198 / MUCL 43194) TaxID=747089 RepID=U9TF90_RHIID
MKLGEDIHALGLNGIAHRKTHQTIPFAFTPVSFSVASTHKPQSSNPNLRVSSHSLEREHCGRPPDSAWTPPTFNNWSPADILVFKYCVNFKSYSCTIIWISLFIPVCCCCFQWRFLAGQ